MFRDTFAVNHSFECLISNRTLSAHHDASSNRPNRRRIRARFEATVGDTPQTPSPIRTAGRPLLINQTPLEATDIEEFDTDLELESSDFEMPTLQELLAERRP